MREAIGCGLVQASGAVGEKAPIVRRWRGGVGEVGGGLGQGKRKMSQVCSQVGQLLGRYTGWEGVSEVGQRFAGCEDTNRNVVTAGGQSCVLAAGGDEDPAGE